MNHLAFTMKRASNTEVEIPRKKSKNLSTEKHPAAPTLPLKLFASNILYDLCFQDDDQAANIIYKQHISRKLQQKYAYPLLISNDY